MDEKKLVLAVHKSEPIKGDMVRINKTAASIINRIMVETGLSARAIASQMIIYCADKYDVEVLD